jgi:oxysterol-binding protein-related protein 8
MYWPNTVTVSMLTSGRDGSTPEEQTTQIMQITAILPGQSPPKRFTIPSRKSSVAAESSKSQVVQTENVPTQDDPAKQAQVPGNGLKYDGRADTVTASLKDLDINSSDRTTEHVPVRRMDSQTSEVDEFHDAEP